MEWQGKFIGDFKVKGENFYCFVKKIKIFNVFKEGKVICNKDGKIIKVVFFQSRECFKVVIELN